MAAEPTQEQVVEEVYRFAAEQIRNGVPSVDIERSLIEQGLDPDSARTVVDNLQQVRSKAMKKAGTKNMIYGALWFVGGSLVTAFTYREAAAGGKYVVAWGAILFGGIQFVRGLIQSTGKS